MIKLDMINCKELFIWGTSVAAVKTYYEIKDSLNVLGFIDSYDTLEPMLCGKKIIKPNYELLKGYFIIVATGGGAYREIKQLLINYGFSEFKDFIWYKYNTNVLEEKKRVGVVVHGNCHVSVINQYLTRNKKFNEKYEIIQTPRIYEFKQNGLDENVLRNCDVFIHQDIRADNGFGYNLSDEYIIPLLKKNCINICIPNLFGMGSFLFPQCKANARNCSLGHDFNGMFPHGDEVIDLSIKERIDVANYDFGCDKIKENFDLCMDKICKREVNWDVKVLNFILQNFQTKKLFWDIGHPSNEILYYISKQILNLLGINDLSVMYDSEIKELDEFENPVYSSVKSCLKLNFDDTYIRKSKTAHKLAEIMDFDEYVKEYKFWCYGI